MRIALLTAAVALLVAGCGEGDDPTAASPARPVVTIKTFMFAPDPVTVKRGTTVTFTNVDQTRHTVTSGTRARPDGRFDEKLGPDDTVTVPFDEPGRHRYVCTLHQGPGMEGEVIVL